MEANVVAKTHPLIIAAAASVTVLSLAGVGAIFGVIPTGNGDKPAAPVAEVHAVATAQPAAAPVVGPNAPTLSLPAGSSVKIETPSAKPRHTEPAAKTRPQPTREAVYDDRPAPAPSRSGQIRVANDEAPSVYAERADRAPRYDPPEPPAARRTAAPPVCRDCGTIAGVREVSTEGSPVGIGAVAGGVLGGVVGHQMGGGRGRDAMTVLGAIGGAFAGNQVEKSQRSTHEYEVTVRFDDGATQVFKQATMPVWRQGERVQVNDGKIAAL